MNTKQKIKWKRELRDWLDNGRKRRAELAYRMGVSKAIISQWISESPRTDNDKLYMPSDARIEIINGVIK